MKTHSLVVLAASLLLSGNSTVMAQSVRTPVGMDVFAGGIPRADQTAEQPNAEDFPRMGGWQAGASFRVGQKLQWLGLTGSYGSHSNDQASVREVVGGLRATSPWLTGDNFMVRGFGHALAGHQWSKTLSGIEDGGPAVVAGGGVDIFLFRIQVDYVHANLTGVQTGYTRSFIGGVVPLCFTGCRPDWQDGFPLANVTGVRR